MAGQGNFDASEERPFVVDLHAIPRRNAEVGGARSTPWEWRVIAADEGQPLVTEEGVLGTLPVMAEPEVGEINIAPANPVGRRGDTSAAPDSPIAVRVVPELVMRAHTAHAVAVELTPRRRADVECEELAEVPGRGQ